MAIAAFCLVFNMAYRRKQAEEELKRKVRSTAHVPVVSPTHTHLKDPAAYEKLMAARSAALNAADLFNTDVLSMSASMKGKQVIVFRRAQ